MKFHFIALCCTVALALSASAEPIIEIPKIAGKSPKEVAAVLGKPSKEEKSKHGPRLYYQQGKIEVVFIGGKADWITVSEMSEVPFDERAIVSLGLKQESPTFSNSNVIRWEPHSLYRSVSVFPANGKVDYAYIRVATK